LSKGTSAGLSTFGAGPVAIGTYEASVINEISIHESIFREISSSF